MATMMAMARHFDGLVTRGVFTSYVSIAHAHGLSLVHVNRIMSLCFLAPDIQEQLLFLQQECDGSDPVGWRDIIPLTREPNWTTQREHETGILLKALAARQQCH